MTAPEDAPLAPEPDTKNWTWVIERPCDECGFVASELAADDVGAMLRALADRYADLLRRDEVLVRARPAAATWSALEYGAHVRDVCRVYLGRVDRMLTEDAPHYANWDQDATAIEERYDLQDPEVVAQELISAAETLADRFDEVEGAAWQRTGHRSDGAAFTVDSIARYFLHDVYHHEWDIHRGFETLGSAST